MVLYPSLTPISDPRLILDLILMQKSIPIELIHSAQDNIRWILHIATIGFKINA